MSIMYRAAQNPPYSVEFSDAVNNNKKAYFTTLDEAKKYAKQVEFQTEIRLVNVCLPTSDEIAAHKKYFLENTMDK